MTHSSLIEIGDVTKCVAVVSKVPTHFNHLIYHSYIVQDDKVYDMAMNLIMNKKDYYKLFTPQPIASFNKQEFNSTLEQLQTEEERHIVK